MEGDANELVNRSALDNDEGRSAEVRKRVEGLRRQAREKRDEAALLEKELSGVSQLLEQLTLDLLSKSLAKEKGR